MAEINLIAVLVAALSSLVLGVVWYSSDFFIKQWQLLVGLSAKKSKELKQHAKEGFFWTFISTLVMSYVLGYFITITGSNTMAEGMNVAFWIWVGFVATVILGSLVHHDELKELYLLNAMYNLLSLLAMGAIIGGWAL